MIDAILGVLGSIIYPLFSIIFLIIDIVQNIFKAFAGTGNVTIADIHTKDKKKCYNSYILNI